MLAEITIENLGVIPVATTELDGGLTVLTGETGAGKTMVVSGLRLLCGGRADASRVRTGATQAVVEGRFLIDGLPGDTARAVSELVDAAGGTADENGEFIASRTVNATGRSRAHLGGRSVPAATLADFTADLLTIHGQNDQLRLLSPERQLAALDRFDPAVAPLLVDYREAWKTWRDKARDLKERTTRRRELAQEVDRLRFAIGEIDEADPSPGEDLELKEQIRRLQDVDGLREQATSAVVAVDGPEALGGGDGVSDVSGASDLLGAAQSALAGSQDPVLAAVAARLGEMTSQLGEISAELGAFLSGLPADPDALEQMLQRQQQLKQLTRKYAADIDGVLAWRDKARRKLAAIDVSGEAVEKLQAETLRAEKKMLSAAKKLTRARTVAAERLGSEVTTELHGLAMAKSRFEVALRQVAPGPDGADDVEFLLAATPDAEARALATTASGGELSRVMLALEVILSAGTSGTTLVFDEVDAGVGGRAAVEIGRRLARLAVDNQVIVVTHLPQVAAFADTHLHVAKQVGDSAVTSGVEVLDEERRVEEISRMLAGLDDTATGRAHARELLDTAEKVRSGFH
ncbi:DNA repair protein RecN [Corynebacterium sp. P7202]|uniref:DNA repair protein RecN n=1 Tax=Corynebacterium pygosceleis TaxID=2800406 RepID=A0A9Q4C7A5_9CORY|nr:DNA repair protein RecN [Corynebacterium pygosceleis]MCK7637136.1 DNA repair protein RecN [Corynebacterium pygosceleis]MCX7443636.1 DNA repair protein RecN [Corynebacterium pygosceleis]MCX7467890.1 DNA repair protein RecN [Corynebacterium pygosceleis]